LCGFGSQKTSFFDPIHEFLRTALLVGDLVDFSIEKVLFYLLQVSTTIVVPSCLGMSSNVYNLGIFVPYSVDIIGE